jgi:outer membrane assembly lipoprotein YfiO
MQRAVLLIFIDSTSVPGRLHGDAGLEVDNAGLGTDSMIPGTTPDMHRMPWRHAVLALLVMVAACHPEFSLKEFTSNEALYAASLREFQHRKWDNAVTGFEKLTTDLPPRDTLLPRSYWYLASAHQHLSEYLLAAQSYSRLYESFPEDSLADDAALESSRSYARLWRRPQLDPVYGETAIASYNTLIGLYPNSPLVKIAEREIADLENRLAIKDFEAGDYYVRRKFYDSGIIFFKDVLTKYGNTPTARIAEMRMVEAYKAIKYPDAADHCARLRARFPNDREVERVCQGVPVVALKPDSAVETSVGSKPPAR